MYTLLLSSQRCRTLRDHTVGVQRLRPRRVALHELHHRGLQLPTNNNPTHPKHIPQSIAAGSVRVRLAVADSQTYPNGDGDGAVPDDDRSCNFGNDGGRQAVHTPGGAPPARGSCGRRRPPAPARATACPVPRTPSRPPTGSPGVLCELITGADVWCPCSGDGACGSWIGAWWAS
jgi:hypothetical protein